MNRVSIIGIDFISAEGHRIFCYQLCEQRDGRLEAIAVVNDLGSSRDVKTAAILKGKERAIRRLANIWKKRSVPQKTQSSTASAIGAINSINQQERL